LRPGFCAQYSSLCLMFSLYHHYPFLLIHVYPDFYFCLPCAISVRRVVLNQFFSPDPIFNSSPCLLFSLYHHHYPFLLIHVYPDFYFYLPCAISVRRVVLNQFFCPIPFLTRQVRYIDIVPVTSLHCFNT
jgi:hypothetical protein